MGKGSITNKLFTLTIAFLFTALTLTSFQATANAQETPTDYSTMESIFSCGKKVNIISSKGTIIEKPSIPGGSDTISTTGNLFTNSGSFKAPEKEGDPEPKPVSIGPFKVASGGTLSAHIVGTPPVPNRWSMGNWNSGLTIYYQSVLKDGPQQILSLGGQATDNDLSGTAQWPGPGWISAVVSPARGYGVFFGSFFDQSYTATVDITEIKTTIPAAAGTTLGLGDILKTGPGGGAFVSLPGGTTAWVGSDSEFHINNLTAAGTVQLPASSSIALGMKLKDYAQYGLPLPEGVTQANIADFLDTYHEGTLDAALQLIGENKDPYEAALLVKLYLEANRGQWTASKIASEAWGVKGPDGTDVMEILAKKYAQKAIPVVGMISIIDDAMDVIELIDREITASQARDFYSSVFNTAKNTKGLSTRELNDKINSLNHDIEKAANALDDLYYRIQQEKQAAIDALVAEYNAGQITEGILRVAIPGHCKEIDDKYAAKKASIFAQMAATDLCIDFIQQHRLPEADKKATNPDPTPACVSSMEFELKTGYAHFTGKSKEATTYQIKFGGAVVKPKGTDFILRYDGASALVSVKEGSVDIIDALGKSATVTAGNEIDIQTGLTAKYDPAGDKFALMDGIPSDAITMDDVHPQNYGTYELDSYSFKKDWLWQDPNTDVATEFKSDGTLHITVPDNNDLWDDRNTAPKLLHKVTGDFVLSGDIMLSSKGTDFVGAEFLIFAPGTAAGYLAQQVRQEGSAADFLIIGGGWAKQHDLNKLATLNKSIYDCIDAPNQPVKFKLTRKGNIFKTYWSLDGNRWMLSSVQEIKLPPTIWSGWVFKRQAWDRMYGESALNILSDVQLKTMPTNSLPQTQWDLCEGNAELETYGDTITFQVPATEKLTSSAYLANQYQGNFDLVVKYETEPWTRNSGETRNIYLGVKTNDAKNITYIALVEHEGIERRYATDLMINGGWGRYNYHPTNDHAGYFRLARTDGVLATYYWSEGIWVELGNFNTGFADAVNVYLGTENNSYATTAAPITAKFTIESSNIGGAGGNSAWVPASTILKPVPADSNIAVPEDIHIKMWQSPFAIGNMAHLGNESLGLFSAQKGKERLILLSEDGNSFNYITSGILAGTNYKGGVWYDGGMLISVDYAPDSGNNYGGLFKLKSNGDFAEMPLKQPHGGMADIINAPGGGWYFADFENDNIWYLPAEGQDEIAMVKSNMTPGPINVEYFKDAIYFLNLTGGWPFGGENAIYRVNADGEAQLVAKASEGITFTRMAQSQGGYFGQNLYVTDTENGQILRVNEDGTTTLMVSGLINPGQIRFTKNAGDLVVVCGQDGKNIVKISSAQDVEPEITISLNKMTTEIFIGQTEQLRATITPSGFGDSKTIWSSDDTDVATVDSHGRVTALQEGIAFITATIAGTQIEDFCMVAVKKQGEEPTNVVSINKKWTIHFNQDVKHDYPLNNDKIEVTDADGNLVAIEVTFGDSKDKLIVFPPAGGYERGETYTLTVKAGLPAQSGQTIQEDVTKVFNTQV